MTFKEFETWESQILKFQNFGNLGFKVRLKVVKTWHFKNFETLKSQILTFQNLGNLVFQT